MNKLLLKKKIIIESLDARLDELNKLIKFLLRQKNNGDFYALLNGYLNNRVEELAEKIDKLCGDEKNEE